MDNKYLIGAGGFILLVVLMVLLVFQSNKFPSMEGSPLDFNFGNNSSPAPTAAPQITQLQAQEIKVTDMLPTEPMTVVLSEKGWIRAAKGHERGL